MDKQKLINKLKEEEAKFVDKFERYEEFEIRREEINLGLPHDLREELAEKRAEEREKHLEEKKEKKLEKEARKEAKKLAQKHNFED